MSENLQDSLWIEKYRPTKLGDMVLPEKYFNDFNNIITTKKLPNLLFSGPPGSGKSTLARLLCSKHGVLFNKKDNLLSVNGSAKKSRGIAYVDDVIEPFLKHPPARDKYKIVFIDEADNLTSDSYDSLRAIIEKYHSVYGRFVFTCNYLSKIPEPIQSRFTPYSFSRIPKEFILEYCKKILEAENVTYDDKDIQIAINNLYPDVRRVVNTIQQNSLNGKLKISEDEVITKEKKIISLIIQIISFIERNQDAKIGGLIGSITELISDQDVEYRNVYSELFYGNIPVPVKLVVNEYTNKHQDALVPPMHFMAMVFKIITILKNYRAAVVGK